MPYQVSFQSKAWDTLSATVDTDKKRKNINKNELNFKNHPIYC